MLSLKFHKPRPMSVNTKEMITNLLDFYDLADKTIIAVGAGGGQFIEYGRNAKKVIAIDNDELALEKLKDNLIKAGLTDKFTIVNSDFYLTDQKGDVVIFELSLHEMHDPTLAVKHAFTLAPDVLVLDHWKDSEWLYIIDEKEKVIRSWTALEAFKSVKFKQYDTFEFFFDYEELCEMIQGQGQTAISRTTPYKNKQHFTIPLTYALCIVTAL